MKIDDLPMHKDEYFFGYGIDIEKPTEMVSQIIKLRKENQELEKQLEDLFNENRTLRKKIENHMTFEDYNHTLSEKVKLKKQQKEFIEYLTSYIELLNNKPDLIEESQKDILKEILSKYKEITGDKE